MLIVFQIPTCKTMFSWKVCFTQETLYSVTASVNSITGDERNNGPKSENSAIEKSCSKMGR